MAHKTVFFSWFKGLNSKGLPILLDKTDQHYVVKILPELTHINDTNVAGHPNFHQCNTTQDVINKINEINPDFAFFWNGYQGQQPIIKGLNKSIKVVYVEWGWFPQSGNISIHKEGPHIFSELVHMKVDDIEIDNNLISPIRNRYLKNLLPPKIKDYILIPLQLDGDTQLNKSHLPFNDQYELVTHIRKIFPQKNIVVKIHPKSTMKDFTRKLCVNNNCIYAEDKQIINWIFHSDFVVGINSTSLIESLFLHKKTVAFGKNVYRNKDLVLDCTADINNVKNVNNFHVDDERKIKMDKFSTLLLTRQFCNIPNEITSDDKNNLINLLETF